uniref:Uncharacterized protein n=1 Tax=Caenorhabditis tropicalis TaxID=1561998 RepID=A0A1I7TL49_9PELO
MCPRDCYRVREERIAKCERMKMAYGHSMNDICKECQEEEKQQFFRTVRREREESGPRFVVLEWMHSLTNEELSKMPIRSKEKYEKAFEKVRARLPRATMEEVRMEALASLDKKGMKEMKKRRREVKERELRRLRAAYGKRDSDQEDGQSGSGRQHLRMMDDRIRRVQN